jgi:hypothetical protein
MRISKQAKETLTPVELDHGDVLAFTLANGRVVTLALQETGFALVTTQGRGRRADYPITVYRFFARVAVNGTAYTLEREVPSASTAGRRATHASPCRTPRCASAPTRCTPGAHCRRAGWTSVTATTAKTAGWAPTSATRPTAGWT